MHARSCLTCTLTQESLVEQKVVFLARATAEKFAKNQKYLECPLERLRNSSI